MNSAYQLERKAALRSEVGQSRVLRGCFRICVFTLVLYVLFASGCAVGPNYKRPAVSAPQVYRNAEGTTKESSIADLPWWEVFKNDDLQRLVKTALENNQDLKVAVARVEQARQAAAQARAQYFPFVNYSSIASAGKNDFGGALVPTNNKTQGTFIAIAGATWEADIWGRIRRLNEAARAQYLSTEEARRGVMLSVVSDTAQAYFELLALQLQLNIARQTTDSFTQTLDLFTKRLEGGIASKLDTSRAEAARATAAATIPELEREIAIKENQISILIGENPGEIAHRAQLLEEVVPPDVPVGLPSALLERRPDILEAEQQMSVASAQIGVATAAFFPRLGLTTFLGGASSPLTELTSGKGVWSVATNLSGPIYQGGALKARKREAVNFWEETKAHYEQTVLTAFQDVSDALISRRKYEETRTAQIQAVEAYRESVSVSLLRYMAGRASYYEVLEAQQQLFPAENALAITELNRRVAVVQLYRTLGGGWNLTDPQWMSPQSQTQPQPFK